MTAQPKEITRLETAQLKFAEGEVLPTYSSRETRAKAIHKATYFGNLNHTKVTIVFNAGESVYQVNTTIWLHYNGSIFLKDNVTLPVERVLEVQF